MQEILQEGGRIPWSVLNGHVNHPLFARFYARLSRSAEPVLSRRREELVAGLSGRVIEIGAGNGLNFAHYPGAVTEVTAVEPEPYLRRLAELAAAAAPVPVRIVDGVAERLQADDHSFDGAVSSLVLCSVTDQGAALAELGRVLRPGGELRFFEHVRDFPGRRARVQALCDRSGLWPFVAGGCRCSRDTVSAIELAGFTIERVDRLHLPPAWSVTNPMVLGVARAPQPG